MFNISPSSVKYLILSSNLMNLNRVDEPPIAGLNCALAQILKHF